MAGVVAREMNGSCNQNQPCPVISAIEARNRLVQLFGGPKANLREGHMKVRSAPMTCRSDGSARGSLTAAWCSPMALGTIANPRR